MSQAPDLWTPAPAAPAPAPSAYPAGVCYEGAGQDPAAAAGLQSGLYDGGVDLFNVTPRPNYVEKPLPPLPAPLPPLLQDRRVKAVQDFMMMDLGIPGLPGFLETTPGDLIFGTAGRSVANGSKGVGQSGDPARAAPPVPGPRLTPGEEEAAVRQRDAELETRKLLERQKANVEAQKADGGTP